MNILKTNSEDSDQMPYSEVSDLGQHCLPKSHKRDARLLWIHVGIKEVNVLFPVCKFKANDLSHVALCFAF